jgi:hypothetical protein
VHYNPEEPSEAVLITGTSWVGYLLLIFGCPFLLIGIVNIRARFRDVG